MKRQTPEEDNKINDLLDQIPIENVPSAMEYLSDRLLISSMMAGRKKMPTKAIEKQKILPDDLINIIIYKSLYPKKIVPSTGRFVSEDTKKEEKKELLRANYSYFRSVYMLSREYYQKIKIEKGQLLAKFILHKSCPKKPTKDKTTQKMIKNYILPKNLKGGWMEFCKQKGKGQKVVMPKKDAEKVIDSVRQIITECLNGSKTINKSVKEMKELNEKLEAIKNILH